MSVEEFNTQRKIVAEYNNNLIKLSYVKRQRKHENKYKQTRY